MRAGETPRRLRLVLRALAVVAVIAGSVTVLTGSATLPGAGRVAPSVESELRFYAVWWVGAGLFLWWLAPHAVERTAELRAFLALLFAAGCSRLLAAADAGWPSDGQVVLLLVELALPPWLVTWQHRARRAGAAAPGEPLAEVRRAAAPRRAG